MLMVLVLLTCRSSHCRCFIKKVFFKISQNSQENTCIGVSFLKKIAAWRPAALLKKRLKHRCFPVNFLRNFYEHLFGRTPFFRSSAHGSIVPFPFNKSSICIYACNAPNDGWFHWFSLKNLHHGRPCLHNKKIRAKTLFFRVWNFASNISGKSNWFCFCGWRGFVTPQTN